MAGKPKLKNGGVNPWRGGRLPREEVDRRIARLLEIAVEEFAANGFGGTSLDTLVQRSGVSKTTIFRRFGTKEGLFQTLVTQSVDAIQSSLWTVELDENEPEQTITDFVATYTDIAISNPLGHMLLGIALAEKRTFPTLGAMILTYAHQGLQPISDYIEQLMDKGVLRRGDAREVTFDLQALMSHGFRVMVDDPKFLRRPGRAQEIARRFMKGWS